MAADFTAVRIGKVGHRAATWHATDWTECLPPADARHVIVTNRGTLPVYVSYPTTAGAWASTNSYESVGSGGQLLVDLNGGSFAFFGADGAAHEAAFTFLGADWKGP